jgi:hypothetical protein
VFITGQGQPRLVSEITDTSKIRYTQYNNFVVTVVQGDHMRYFKSDVRWVGRLNSEMSVLASKQTSLPNIRAYIVFSTNQRTRLIHLYYIEVY